MTLRWRLALVYAGLMAFVLFIIAGIVYAALSNYLYASLRAELGSTIEQALRNLTLSTAVPNARTVNWDVLSSSVLGQDNAFLDETADYEAIPLPTGRSQGLSALGDPEATIDIGSSGRELLRRYQGDHEEGSFQDEGFLRVNRRAVPVLYAVYYKPGETRFGSSDSGDRMVYYPMLITVARELDPVLGALSGLRSILFVVSAVGLVVALLGSYAIAGRALGPIIALGNAAAGITGQALNLRVPEPNTGDEVDSLAKALNHMLARLEESFESQRRFTADASHELRTPVTAIAGHASYLLRRTNPSDAQRESLEIIRSESVRLSKLVSDLLDLARADAGFPLEVGIVDLRALAEDVAREVKPIQGESVLEVFGPEALYVPGDPNRLRQVLLNLVQNAIKIGAAHVRIFVEREGAQAKLAVADDGPGIPTEHLSRLFDRFYRVDTSRDRAVGGAGLGLAIVKWIVDAHGGTVMVWSQVGVGTRFSVYLPMREE